jgi:alpha-N-acetylglucosamine transferase
MTPTLNQDDIKLLKSIFATKADLKAFATKADLKKLATKTATKADLKKLATKTDLKNLEIRIIKRMDDMDNFLDRETVRLAREIDKLKPGSVQYA